MCFPILCLGELESRTDRLEPQRSLHRRTCGVHGWPACFKMLNPNSGRKQVPIQFRSDTWIVSQCPVLFMHLSLLLLPVFPLFVLRKLVGPGHTPSTMTPQIPQEQLLQTSSSWESTTLESGYSCGLVSPNKGCSFSGLRYF